MSQQEFEPQQQNERSTYTQNDEARPYYWSTQTNTGNMPKNEHPATFEDSIPPYSYRAQDEAQQSQQSSTAEQSARQDQGHQGQQFSPDGDAMEYGYRPYTQYNQVPPWARPQRGNPVGRILVLLVLGFLLIKFLIPLLLGLLIGAIALAFIIALVVGFFALITWVVLAAFGIRLRPRIFRPRRSWWR